MFNFLITLERVHYNISDILNSAGLVFNKEKNAQMHKSILKRFSFKMPSSNLCPLQINVKSITYNISTFHWNQKLLH